MLGVEVSGIDVKQLMAAAGGLTPHFVKELNRLWAEEGNGILILKRQHLGEKELHAFAAEFGHVMAHPFQNNTNEHHQKYNSAVKEVGGDVPMEVMTVRNRSDTWHTDMTWMKTPPRATFLQCVERGPEMATDGEECGTWGDTLIASMTGAYDMLSPELQRRLEGMTAMHGVQDLMLGYGEESSRRTWTTARSCTRTAWR